MNGKIAYNYRGALHIMELPLREVQIHPIIALMTNPAWHPSGHGVTFGYRKLHTLNMQTDELTALLDDPMHQWDPTWAPDGERLAFARRDGENGIYILNTTTGDLQRLSLGVDMAYNPHWHPQKDRLVCALGNVGGDVNLHIVDLKRPNAAPIVLTQGNKRADRPAWSPDGTQIAFSSNESGAWSLYIINADGSNHRQITQGPPEGGDFYPAWSPDGTQIVFERVEDNLQNLFVMNADGTDVVQLTTEGGREPDWWGA